MAEPNCTGGTIPSLQVENTDCSCISIQSITWNNAGNQFTITLNNGQSITSPVLVGAAGATPTITFRASGNTLQYNVNGGSWINLYDLSQLVGSKVLSNQFPNLATLGTSYESLLVGRTPYVLPANTLTGDGDEITIHAVFLATNDDPDPTQLVRVTFNGSALNTPLNIGFYAKNIYKIVIDTRMVRVSNTSIKYEQCVTFYVADTAIFASTVGANEENTFQQAIQTVTGLDLTATAYNIDAQGNSDTIGDIKCEAFEVVYYKKP